MKDTPEHSKMPPNLPMNILDRTLDIQKARKKVDKDLPDPGVHGVGLGGPEVNIEDHYGHTDTVITTTHSGRRRRSCG